MEDDDGVAAAAAEAQNRRSQELLERNFDVKIADLGNACWTVNP